MYKVVNFNYHYYWELTNFLDKLYESGRECIQILDIKSSGDNEKMHQADILTKAIQKNVQG